ncbi:hypothetical protein CCAX7_46340 [Capsulimonas corticalis]|uniref:Uncharacterized protein n=1 Tax=Capsulimonas corticalis TaxID=2219043 RepID=A0A402D507_9BACT|nr:hypothetical protein [Capsulimonas corticalis]BDI32583.1 hypothetical protein CCAX7_46340 [Capsulimonas corticalis]
MSGRIFDGQLAPEFNPFADNYLSDIVSAIATAWYQLKHPNEEDIEIRITNRLVGRLVNSQDFANLPFIIDPQCQIVDIDGEIIGIIDIRFILRNSGREYFALEAKRVHITNSKGQLKRSYSSYVGKGGMMDFVNGKYSAGLPACGMLGYVMDGNLDIAWTGISKSIQRNCIRLKLDSTSKLVKSQLCVYHGNDNTRLGETFHDLSTHSVRMMHLLLPRSTA